MTYHDQGRNLVSTLFNGTKKYFLCLLALFLISKNNINVNVGKLMAQIMWLKLLSCTLYALKLWENAVARSLILKQLRNLSNKNDKT